MEITNPIVKNAMNACGTAKNASGATSRKLQAAISALHELAAVAKEEGESVYHDVVKAAKILTGVTPSW